MGPGTLRGHGRNTGGSSASLQTVMPHNEKKEKKICFYIIMTVISHGWLHYCVSTCRMNSFKFHNKSRDVSDHHRLSLLID